MKTRTVILCGLIFLLGLLVGTSWQPGVVSAQGGTVSDEYEWVLQTRVYSASGGTWDAYLFNVRSGELYFINQATKTLVKEGKAKGASKR